MQQTSHLTKWIPLLIMSMVAFIMFLDTTMMNVAVSAIVVDLETTLTAMQVSISFFALIMASFMVAGGKLGELYGLKKMFVIGMVMYAIGTTAASLAPSIEVLFLGWSVIEGLAVAILLPITTIFLTLLYTGADRVKALGIFTAIGAAAAAIGPIYGGIMTSYFSWRWAFASELIFVIAVFLLLRYIPDVQMKDKTVAQKLDTRGMVLLAFGLMAVLFGVMGVSRYGLFFAKEPLEIFGYEFTLWGLSVVPFLWAIGVGLLGWFVAWEKKLMREGREPLLDVRILRVKQFSAGVWVGALMSSILAGLFFILPVFFQKGFGYSAVGTGVALLPITVALVVASLVFSSKQKNMSPRRIVEWGILAVLVGVVFLFVSVGEATTARALFPGFLMLGVGFGMISAQIVNLVMSSVDASRTAGASGLNNTLRQFGSSLGTVVIGTALTSAFFVIAHLAVTESDVLRPSVQLALEEALQDSVQVVEQHIDTSGLTSEEVGEIERIASEAMAQSMQTSFVLVGILTLGMFVASRGLPRGNLPEMEEKNIAMGK